MAQERKRVGRPTTPGKAGEKASLGVRVSPALKARLIWAAEENGRSLSQEAELRLERSFETESIHHHIDAIVQHHIDEVKRSFQQQTEIILKGHRREILLSRWLHLEFTLGPETMKELSGGKTVAVEDEDALQELEAAVLEAEAIMKAGFEPDKEERSQPMQITAKGKRARRRTTATSKRKGQDNGR